jgi:hypothetical protein
LEKELVMKKSHLILIGFIFLAVAGLALAAQEVNVSGDWELKATTPRGERVSQVKFEQTGEKLKVTTTGFQGEEVTGEGTLKGSDIQWSIVRSTPRGEFTVTYTGKVEGDTMKGQAVMGDFGTMDWTAARKKA